MHKTPQILLVEDSQKDAELTLAALKRHRRPGQVMITRDGVDTLDYLRGEGKFAQAQALPSLVLLDLKLPRMDGLEVLRQMKTDPRLKRIPVVIFSSSREAHDVERCYELGANAYVVKPVDYPEFTRTVAALEQFWAVVNELPPVFRKSGIST
jgi:two-component system, response regulator